MIGNEGMRCSSKMHFCCWSSLDHMQSCRDWLIVALSYRPAQGWSLIVKDKWLPDQSKRHCMGTLWCLRLIGAEKRFLLAPVAPNLPSEVQSDIRLATFFCNTLPRWNLTGIHKTYFLHFEEVRYVIATEIKIAVTVLDNQQLTTETQCILYISFHSTRHIRCFYE